MAKEDAPNLETQVRSRAIAQIATLFLQVRKLLLASLGTVALTADETSELLAQLVERGEIAESDIQALISEYRARQPKSEHGDGNELPEDDIETHSRSGVGVETILGRLNVPTRTDIEELSRKINALDRKIGKLRGQQE